MSASISDYGVGLSVYFKLALKPFKDNLVILKKARLPQDCHYFRFNKYRVNLDPVGKPRYL